jgi:2-polyprenyl-3-methyl-5-hydroxy-6-metoxy-1,4-benzoquinol methylase
MKINRAQWTSEAEYVGQREDLHREYFTNQVGLGVTEFISHTGRLTPGITVLDYGCGPGFLIRHLLDRGAACFAADSSVKAVELANRKYAGQSGWKGAFVLDGEASVLPQRFELITCLETLEHLPDESLSPKVSEIFQLLNPGGVAVFSTPFNENLGRNNSFCPFCRTEFHPWQHQRSFDAVQLAALLESVGFVVLFCRELNFWEFQRPRLGWKDLTFHALNWRLQKKLNKWMDLVCGCSFPNGRQFKHLLKPGPHLCAVVQRPSAVTTHNSSAESFVVGGTRPEYSAGPAVRMSHQISRIFR